MTSNQFGVIFSNTKPVIFRPFENPNFLFGLGLYMVPNRTSEIQTKWFVFQMFYEIRTDWEWDNFGKRRNPNVRISEVYCSANSNGLYLKIFKNPTKSLHFS